MIKKTPLITIFVQTICWSIMLGLLLNNSPKQTNAFFQASTPQPFLGPIYYEQEDVWQVFDHNLPCASVCDDGNNYVVHYDGSQHDPIIPPTGEPYIPNGYGYDLHAGVDYSLEYEPVLAAAIGTVEEAGWYDPSDHRYSYGLYVTLDHTPETDYETWYGHLSALAVKSGDEITIDTNDSNNRNRILGISGNTGAVFSSGGDCPPVPNNPICGQHLHFEVRLSDQGYKPVNPYGWVAPAGTPDPWANYNPPPPTPAGATSYDLWENKPAILPGITDQYPGGTPLDNPGVNNARMIIDDSSADFVIDQGDCWLPDTGNASYNSGYHIAYSNDSDICIVRWNIKRDAYTPTGDYDLFVNIPQDLAPSLGARYTIHHNQKVSVGIVVQAAYIDNEEPGAWAYLGRYDFAMNDAVAEYITLNDNTLDDDDNHFVLADAIMLAPATPNLGLPQRYVYVSFSGTGLAGNVFYNDEDILVFDAETGEWRIFFDGSDVGLSSVNVDAFDYRNGDLYFSVDQAFGNYIDSDIIRFTPTSLGANTSGSMSLALAGSPYLLRPSEDVDALSFMSSGHYLLSTLDWFAVPNVSLHDDEDIFSVLPGPKLTYSYFLDGSLVGLESSEEDIDALWLDAMADMM